MNASVSSASRPRNLSRRAILNGLGLAAGSLALGLPVSPGPRAQMASGAGSAGPAIGALLIIEPDGRITFLNPFAEGGQGVYTAIPQIVAEELDVPLSSITNLHAPHGPAYRVMNLGQPIRFTGGSLSVRATYTTMRKTGAAAREMLMTAAGSRWNVPATELSTDQGRVLHRASGRSAGYGELAADAAKLPVPAEPTLKDPASFTLIGKRVARVDSREKSTGKAGFGIDVRVPNMAYGYVVHCPVPGGQPRAVKAEAARAMPGVLVVQTLPGAVGVVADSWWRAKQAALKLEIDWDESINALRGTTQLLAEMQARLDEPGVSAETHGDVKGALASASKRVEATYSAPFLAHGAMEPLNCTAHLDGDRLTLWIGNQAPDFFAQVAAQVAGVKIENVTIHTPYLGGFYGRRFVYGPEQMGQAILLSKASGRPVKVVWSREEDIANDQFRPLSTARIRAGLDAQGRMVALHATAVGEGPLGRWFPGFLADPKVDDSVVEGLKDKPYNLAHDQVDYVKHEISFPIGFWRSVGHSMNDFFMESFIDECAHAAGADPFAYRMAMLADGSREKTLLATVAALAGGFRKGPYQEGGVTRAQGVALSAPFGSLVAEIAEVSIEDGEARVHRVWAAIDPGSIVNPAIVERQVEGAMALGLSAALYEQITIEQGRVQQTNFDSYPFLPPGRMPKVEVAIVESGAAMGGVGEPGAAPIAAAVGNAVFVLTGQRIRDLPFAKHQLKSV